MASLKEIRNRINSVTNTRKITGAMKMVSSAKLRKGQDSLARFYPYWQKISNIMDCYFNNDGDLSLTPLAAKRPINKVAIIAISSNSSLCGAFNNNVGKKLTETLHSYSQLPAKNISLVLVGKKIYENFAKDTSYTITGPFATIADKPHYDDAIKIIDDLIAKFTAKEIDAVELVYNKFKSTAIQITTREMLLPLAPQVSNNKKSNINYIIEPNPLQLLQALAPTIAHLQLYNALLNSFAAEHGARTTAMQIATDNANELIDNLVLQYNKVRQNAITKEILDIVGGAEALR